MVVVHIIVAHVQDLEVPLGHKALFERFYLSVGELVTDEVELAHWYDD